MTIRMTRPVRTTAPAVSFLSRADVKAQARVEGAEEDALLDELVAAAVGHLDGWGGVLGLALVTQSWSVSFSGFPAERRLRLPLGPLVDVTSIAWRDAAGVSQAFAAESWRALEDAVGPYVEPVEAASWPIPALRDDAVTVVWRCGFGATAASVPGPIRAAARLLAAHWFDRRHAVDLGAVGPLPLGVESLLAPWKRRRFG